MAEIAALEPGNPYDGGITDQVFTSLGASATVELKGGEIFLFKTGDDLTGTATITSVASDKTKRTDNVSIVIGVGAGKYGIWFGIADGFRDGSTGMVTITNPSGNCEMMVIRPE